jgi:ribosomal protein S18 acetylase RimI-like enzyme
MSTAVRIQRCTAEQLPECLPGLVTLLVDAVDGGASVGFLPPLSKTDAREYWLGVGTALAQGKRILLNAHEAQTLVGSVQLDLATMPNGAHRAEVMKLFVLRSARGHGVGRALLASVEEVARRHDRALLVLDTRPGDAAERLYLRAGYVKAGRIPRYARSAGGSLDDTLIMYRWLEGMTPAEKRS